MDFYELVRVARNWNLEPAEREPFRPLSENTRFFHSQTAFADTAGMHWILEEIPEVRFRRMLNTAQALEILSSEGLDMIQPYQRNLLEQFVTCIGGKIYMLHPLEKHAPKENIQLDSIPQAHALANFIIGLRQASDRWLSDQNESARSIVGYVRRKMAAFRRHRPEMADGLLPIFQALEDRFFTTIDDLPSAFCHCNMQPCNILWDANQIQSIIHWEFCGAKPEAYDAALLIGCIGFEDPEALTGDFTRAFISRLRDASIFSARSWDSFFDLVLTVRYGWLSQWMRAHDEQKRDLEMLYMNLLASQRNYILGQWGLL